MRGLALRLEGPLQSWGGPVAGNDRPSLDVPTKSGVLGLVAGALGVERGEVDRLAALHAAVSLIVRVDRRGSPCVDYHTALDVPTVEGKTKEHAVVSLRRYLADASFTALLVARSVAEGPSLDAIAAALLRPTFAPFLGRRACVPSVPVLAPGAKIFEGDDWRALLDQTPLATPADAAPHDVHLDAELAPDVAHRPRRVRDVLVGRQPRLFGERTVHVATWTPPRTDTRDASSPRPEDTIDPWL